MTFLVRERSKEEYLLQMKQLSASARIQTGYVIRLFDQYCQKKYDQKSENLVIEELKQLKKTKPEEEYKEQLYDVLQGFINELSEHYDPNTIRTMFSYFKRYLVWRGIRVYNEESKVFLQFPKKLKEPKHVLTKEEIRSIIGVAGPKRRMLYLVLSSSAMRIGETVQLRKSDIEVRNGQVTIHIPARYTKTKEGRSVFISTEATELLLPHLKKLHDNDLVFGVNDKYEFAKTVEHQLFAEYRKKAGFCNCDQTGEICIGKYKETNHHRISIHSFRAYAIKTMNRIDFGFGNSIAGHGYYMKRYDTMSEEEKREIYKQAETNLCIFSSTKDSELIQEQNQMLQDEIQRMKQRLEDLENK